MKKKKYIRPELVVIRQVAIPQLLTGTKDGGHIGGNPRTIDDDDDEGLHNAKMYRVGGSFNLWSDDDRTDKTQKKMKLYE